MSTLLHVPDAELDQALGEIRRVLGPGARSPSVSGAGTTWRGRSPSTCRTRRASSASGRPGGGSSC
ncbi:hypothetical protein A7K94_0211760 [Modestobacter sp. VKM Ac-2676]|nr:hypothetical protein A7K94_0211760 [Modestobacter sp. VKM Ac-2676]